MSCRFCVCAVVLLSRLSAFWPRSTTATRSSAGSAMPGYTPGIHAFKDKSQWSIYYISTTPPPPWGDIWPKWLRPEGERKWKFMNTICAKARTKRSKMCLFLHSWKYMQGEKNMISQRGGGKNMISQRGGGKSRSFYVLYRPLTKARSKSSAYIKMCWHLCGLLWLNCCHLLHTSSLVIQSRCPKICQTFETVHVHATARMPPTIHSFE